MNCHKGHSKYYDKNGEKRGWYVTRLKRDISRSDGRRQLDRVYKRDKYICCWCKLFVERVDASREHIIALKDGGSAKDDNVKLAHKWCNNDRDRHDQMKDEDHDEESCRYCA